MKKTLLAILLSVFLFSAMIVPILSQDEWTVGVSVGDVFMYEGTLVEYEADEGVPFPPNMFMIFLETWNESDWIRNTVTDVFGTVITFEQVIHWKDGTETTSTFDDEITSSVTFWAIGANLEPGEEIRPIQWGIIPAIIIDKTIDIEYVDTTRETNYMNQSWTFDDESGESMYHYEYYFDKETGIQVKQVSIAELCQEEGNVTWLATLELVDASVWVIPEFPTGTVMLLIFVAVTVCVHIYRRRKLKGHIG